MSLTENLMFSSTGPFLSPSGMSKSFTGTFKGRRDLEGKPALERAGEGEAREGDEVDLRPALVGGDLEALHAHVGGLAAAAGVGDAGDPARLLALLLRRHDLDAGRLNEPDLHRIEDVGDGPEDARLLGRARLVEILDGRERLHGLHPGGFRRARREILAGYARKLELRPIFRDDGEVLEREAAVDLFHRGRRRRL